MPDRELRVEGESGVCQMGMRAANERVEAESRTRMCQDRNEIITSRELTATFATFLTSRPAART